MGITDSPPASTSTQTKPRSRRLKRATRDDEWYTPPVIIEALRTTLGEIDLDPASSKEANAHVKAKHYYTIKDDGLCMPWKGAVWCNPPLRNHQVNGWIGRCRAHSEPTCMLLRWCDIPDRLIETADGICFIRYPLIASRDGYRRFWGPNASNNAKASTGHSLLVVVMLRCKPKGNEWAAVGPVR